MVRVIVREQNESTQKMKALKARITKCLMQGTLIETCDNSGAKLIRIISVRGQKTVKGRMPSAGVADFILGSVIKGTTLRKQVVPAIIVRQKKEYRRLDGTRICFADNACVVLKDDKGNPKGTLVKGPIAKEVVGRWPAVAKIAKAVL